MAERRRPWLASYPPDVPHSLAPFPEKPVWSLLEESAERFPNAGAVAFPVAPMARRLTYRELKEEAERFAGALVSLGVGKGDRVGLVLPNSPQYVVAFFAIQRLGAVAVGNNPLYTRPEMTHQLKDAGIETLIVLDRLYPLIGKIRDEVGLKQVVVTEIGDYLAFPINKLARVKQKREARHEGQPWPPVPEDHDVIRWPELMARSTRDLPPLEVNPKEDVAALMYTGGTTGLSKGAMLTHHNLVSNAIQTGAWFTDVRDGEEAIMCVLPFFHSYGLSAVMNVGISRAMKLVLQPRFELEMALKAIDKENVTLFPGVPRIYIAINEAEDREKYDLSSIRACFSGAAPLPVTVAEKFEGITGGRLVEGYGLTETSPVTHINPIYGKRKFGSIGLPIPDTDCKIVDLDDPEKEVPPGQEGELCIAGPQIMKGYWNRPEETEEMIRVHADGTRWLHTGDIATVDDEGYFSIVDRKKDMILVSGFNVYPTEVEQVLYRHPKIQQVAVAGVPDERTGEAVKAYVVLKEGQQATVEEIMSWARDPEHGLAGYRAPKHVEFRQELPTTMVGKVLRRVLVDEEKQKQAAAA
ncbi:MAG TPA: long-chain fatty acid--CoA ligase, partial [Actinomycetota bacterium]|nr:long-chain fatty acid--CoA ligase [Actinomycetota bacterium]